MYTCIHINIFTYLHIDKHTHTHTYMYTHIQVYVCTCVFCFTDMVCEFLHRRFRHLRALHQVHDLRQHGVRPHPLCPHMQSTAQVHAAPHHGSAHRLGDRCRFPSEHALVHVRFAEHDPAVGGDFGARKHFEGVVALDEVDVDLLLLEGLATWRGWGKGNRGAVRRRMIMCIYYDKS